MCCTATGNQLSFILSASTVKAFTPVTGWIRNASVQQRCCISAQQWGRQVMQTCPASGSRCKPVQLFIKVQKVC